MMIPFGGSVNIKFILIFLVCYSLFDSGMAERYRKTLAKEYINNSIQGIQWVEQLPDTIVYSKQLLELLNGVKTLEQADETGGQKYDFKEEDMNLLTEFCQDSECMRNKSKSIVKYKGKLEAVQCMNVLIIEDVLVSANTELNKRTFRNTLNCRTEIKPQKTISRMLALLYLSKINAHNWLWIVHLRLLAAEDCELSKEATQQNRHFGDDQLMDDLSLQLNLCQQYKYLPENIREQLIDGSEVNHVVDDFRQTLYENDESVDESMKELYALAERFVLQNLTLSIIHDHDEILFKKIPEVDVNWEKTKLLLNIEKNKITKKPYAWIRQPFFNTGYHDMVFRVIEVNVLCLLWKHFATLQLSIKHLSLDVTMKVTGNKINNVYLKLIEWFPKLAKQMGFNDLFFQNILDNLSIVTEDFDYNIILARQMKELTDDLYCIIMDALENLGINRNEAPVLFSLKTPYIQRRTEILTPEISGHIDHLKEYILPINNILKSVDFSIIQFFIDGKAKLAETFFMQF